MRGVGNFRNLIFSLIRFLLWMVIGCSSLVNLGGIILFFGNLFLLVLGVVLFLDMVYFGMVVFFIFFGFFFGILNFIFLVVKILWKWFLYFLFYYECSKFKIVFKCLVIYVWYWVWFCMWLFFFYFSLYKCILYYFLDEDD